MKILIIQFMLFICFMKINPLVAVRKRIFSKRQTLKPSNLLCNDPSKSELEKKFIKFQSSLKQIEDLINLPDNQKYIPENIKIVNTPVASTNDTMVYGEKDCKRVISKNSFHNRGLCPWYTALKYRTDRYPFIKTDAVCSCKDCSHLKPQSAFEYKCKPHEILTPILYRTEKCVNGTHEWNVGLEKTSIACLCKSDYDRKIERKR